MSHVLFVCTTCASVWQDGKRVGESGGDRLLKSLQAGHQNWGLQAEFAIQPVACMSACDRACVISFVAAGKHTYLFGDLLKDRVSDSASDSSSKLLPQEIFECAEKYYKHPEGLLPWADRPVLLKKGILAKIPPI